MSTTENKSLLQHVFSETAKGNGKPFVDALAEHVSWTIIGSTPWSKTYEGKAAVLRELLGPLNRQLADRNTITAQTFIADGDRVAVEGRGHNTTKDGKSYNNRYCWVFRFANGRVVELTEYTDTALIESPLHGADVPGALRAFGPVAHVERRKPSINASVSHEPPAHAATDATKRTGTHAASPNPWLA